MNVFKKTIAAAAILAASTSAAFSADIVDTAAGNESFSTLVAAVKAAGLVETLKGDGPFTVFAPTNDAFAALPAGTVENLLKPENKDQLVAVLTYHVVPGKVMSTDLTDDAQVATVQGGNVTIDLDNGPMVNDAKVVTADIETDNGVIHVINKVILPK
ncbi:MAG: fasciclin domain-containing protein [Pseudomonadota bacterium]